MIRIIIVEDEPAVARGLSKLIGQCHPDFQVLGICRNGKEGLQKILEEKPDLVFVDINMPVMNGLDMIEEVQKSGIQTRCIILTGYAEFEYARTAIRLGVSDYLLKPISPDTLEELLTACLEQHQASLRILQTEYIQRNLTKKLEEATEKCNPLTGYSCTLLFLFFGPMCSNTYNDTIFHENPRFVGTDLQNDIEKQYRITFLPLRGHYNNEAVYALVCPSDRTIDAESIAQKLYLPLQPSDASLHIVISDRITDGARIYKKSRETYLYALFHNPFGFGFIQMYKEFKNEPIHVSPEIQKICAGIGNCPNQESIREFLHSMLSYWQQEQVTQFQLTADIRYFISTVIKDCSQDNLVYPDAAEIVSTCLSYEELEKAILYELDRIYHFDNGLSPGTRQSLAKQVKNWLDKNFTAQISYKIFQDLFGYNEKYISAVFKAEFGISPNKYISELRLGMAKKLMQSNPDILLKDVAEMVGFTDAFYFSRVFKSHEGISPSQYMNIGKSDRIIPDTEA